MLQKYKINGITVILEKLPHFPSVAFCITFNQGARDETKELIGISHFVEHMLFKGTKFKTAKEISYHAESLGCVLDAFTGKEMTGLYARFLKEFAKPVGELLSEIISHPLFSPADFAKEKEVIFEEIRQSNEDNEEYLFNLFFSTIFPNSSLGYPVTGRFETIKFFSPDLIKEFYWQNYTKNKTVLAAVGELDEEVFQNLAANLNLKENSSINRPTPSVNDYQKINVEVRNDLSSVYLIIGKKIVPQSEKERCALSLFNTALGGSLSSRLFQKLREEAGLVYQVSSFVDLYSDVGVLGIYFVTEKSKLKQTIDILYSEMVKLRKDKLTQNEIGIALNFTKSAIALNLENPLSRAFHLAKNELVFGQTLSVNEVIQKYNQTSKEDIFFIIDKILNDLSSFSIASVGNIKKEELEAILPNEWR